MDEVKAALARVWAGNPVDEIRFRLLELMHPDFTDEQGNPSSHRIVNNCLDPLVVTLETGAEASFMPGSFDAALPEKGAKGQQSMKLTIDGASRRIVQQLERAADGERAPIMAIFREYAEHDLTAPGLVHELTVVNPNVTPTRVTASAVFIDPINQSFPSVLYTTESHPSLI